MPYLKEEIKVSTSGSSGSATGAGAIQLPVCELVALYVNFHASAASTQDTTFTAPDSPLGNAADQTILTLTNTNTDAWEYPRRDSDDNTGSTDTDSKVPYVIAGGTLHVNIAQGDALTDCIMVTAIFKI